jgi:hypothetical protein
MEKHLYLILYAIYFIFINQLLIPDSSIPIPVNEITLAIPPHPILLFPNPNLKNPE